ncbi:helix-turn-helix transcriptional regulator [Terasakiella pusilla]|uniref:helix-turn-helix transcriptional regulator n=1 Tax=Terasakiella pusilla TaxID=64973 RepID=UPI00048B4DBC|nr:helix-turn-helix transcriptional regulator [Terasakiella pusilla]
MNENTRKHIPLGELLLKARNAMGLTQVQVAKSVGISDVSLIRYEKAGIEETGQYPPSQKLAALCILLEIPPAQALYACLDETHDWKQSGIMWHDLIAERADFKFFVEDYKEIVNENRFLRAIIKGITDEGYTLDEDVADWLYEQAKALTRGDSGIKRGMVERGLYDGDVETLNIVFT